MNECAIGTIFRAAQYDWACNSAAAKWGTG
jgi:hypothetical protein